MLRIIRFLCMPICLIFVALAVGMFLSRLPRRVKTKKTRKYILGRLLLLVGVVALYSLSLHHMADVLVYPLESHYRAPSNEALKDIDAIIVLGGGAYRKSEIRPEATLSRASLARTVGAVKLLRRCDARYIVFTGYSAVEGAPTVGEVMSRTALEMGVPDEKIVIEIKASNTFEHPARIVEVFRDTKQMEIEEIKQMKIAVVTSAIHMPRSVMAFEQYFDPTRIVPAPVYWHHIEPPLSVASFVPSVDALSMSTMACHEYLGYLWYKIRPKPKVKAPAASPTR